MIGLAVSSAHPLQRGISRKARASGAANEGGNMRGSAGFGKDAPSWMHLFWLPAEFSPKRAHVEYQSAGNHLVMEEAYLA